MNAEKFKNQKFTTGFILPNFSKRNLGGFTLLELLLYIGLFGVMLSISLVILYQMLRNQDQNRSMLEVEEEANFTLRKIEWALTGATNVISPLQNQTSSILSLTKYNFSQNPLVFSTSGNAFYLARGASSSVSLTSANVKFQNFFVHTVPSIGSNPTSVIMTFSVASEIPKFPASTTLRGTFYLKK